MSFVNQVSHELKTPLTNIRMYAELLDDDLYDADERTRRHLGVIVEESQRLSRLIGNILTFARHQREKLTLRPAPKQLDEVVAAVIEQFRPALDEKGITVELDLAAPHPARLDADAIGQILGNLLSNVEKYAATGHLARVTTRQDGPRLTLTVADAGPGIPPRHRERVFEPFHRVSDALSDGVAGTGIGLGIARTLARLHGGDLVLCPSERGATFEASLHAPLVDESHPAPPPERP
jgi:signal transduction histidine kinase